VAASESMAEMKAGTFAPSALAPYADRRGRSEHDMVRYVGDAAFYFADGRWVEAGYDGKAETRKIEPYSTAYFALIGKHPGLGKVLALGERVVFRLDGVWHETVASNSE